MQLRCRQPVLQAKALTFETTFKCRSDIRAILKHFLAEGGEKSFIIQESCSVILSHLPDNKLGDVNLKGHYQI